MMISSISVRLQGKYAGSSILFPKQSDGSLGTNALAHPQRFCLTLFLIPVNSTVVEDTKERGTGHSDYPLLDKECMVLNHSGNDDQALLAYAFQTRFANPRPSKSPRYSQAVPGNMVSEEMLLK